jgi:integrase
MAHLPPNLRGFGSPFTSRYHTAKYLREGFIEACDLVRKVSSLQISSAAPSTCTSSDPRSKTFQRGSGLSERERLTAHHNAFQDSELKSLVKHVHSIIDLKDFDTYSVSIGAMPKYFYEATIVILAIATGRTIQGALQFPLTITSPEYIDFSLTVGFKLFKQPVWTRTLSKHAIRLPLPDILECLKYQSIRFAGADAIEDGLPYSIISWEIRCLEWLESHLKVSRHSINRRIRDALPRALYQESANPALLDWITTPLQKGNWMKESLSYYLNPSNELTVSAYSNACARLFLKLGTPKDILSLFSSKEIGIPLDEHHRISQLFLNDLSRQEKSKDHIAYHNALARYVLMLLIVATGHRKSNTPFYFPWDILPTENLVFICDKLTVGSEARFVPIPAWLSELVDRYHLHLLNFSDQIKSANPQLANRISQLVQTEVRSDHARNKQINNLTEAHIQFSQFFFVGKDFKVRTITTRDLEKFYSPVSENGIRHFRKSIANSLWNQGLSGHQIEAFLGHNAALHAFGESSAWSITKWAEQVRDKQLSYLVDRGWKSINIKLPSKMIGIQANSVPCYKKSSLSYDGRSITRDSALAKARMIIRDLLPPEWFTAENAKITDEDVTKLKEAALERLSDDPESCDKVFQAIAEALRKARKAKGAKVASALANLTRIEPGPVAITSSRHFAIGSVVRTWWVGRLGCYSKDPNENYIDRLSAIGFCLIAFDAVLDTTTWKELISAIANHETRSVKGCLVVRAVVNKSSRSFEKTIILSPYTAAQIFGFEHAHRSVGADKNVIKTATNRIEKWLRSAPHSGESLSLTQLITVFRAWWLLKLSGTEFAIAIGNYSGPAPNIMSECAIYGIESASSSLSSVNLALNKINSSFKLNRSSAQSQFDKLLREAQGVFEQKEQTNRRQRNQLFKLLQDDEKYAELKVLAGKHSIVSAMLGFLQYMLVEGGIKVSVYSFGTIKTYYSGVNELINIWWDIDLEDLGTADFDKAYNALLRTSPQASFPIWLFHKLLRETRDVAHTTVSTSYDRHLLQCRSSLITTSQFENAWNSLALLKNDGQLVFHAKTFMSISYQYALRTKEALGLNLSNFLPTKPFGILVKRNNIRDLKTKKASIRITQPILANTKYQKHLSGVVTLCEKSPVKNDSIFSDPEKVDSLYSKSNINESATSVLRACTGNLSVVPYSMRHSAATRLAHFALRSPRKIPISTFVENAFKDEIDIQYFTSCFDQGFDSWPFWTDRVSMFLGHTSVDTLLNTYWHSSHVRLAEQTWHASENFELTPQQLASIVGKDRSTISKQLTKLKIAGADDEAIIQESLIVYYIGKSNIPLLSDEPEIEHPKRSLIIPEGGAAHENCGMWVLLHRLLCTRLAENLSIDDTIKLAEQLNISGAETGAFFDTYKRFVDEKEFEDFEPRLSDLIFGAAKRNAGVLRGSIERERGIAAAQRLSDESNEFASKLVTFSKIWDERTKAAKPWFVSRSANELTIILEVLEKIGVFRDQLEFISCNFDNSTLRGVLTRSELNGMIKQICRVSKGSANGRVSEVGVRVKQHKGTKIGDYRDTHRLALVLAAITLSKIASQ